MRIETNLSWEECAARLREAVRTRPAIEGRRHWLTQRCVTGQIRGGEVSLNVEARYVGRIYDRNSWKTALHGRLWTQDGRTVIEGSFGPRAVTGTGQLWILRPFGLILVLLALVVGIEGVAGGRLDYVAGFVLLAPAGIALVVAAPWAVGAVTQRVADDERLLRDFLSRLLESDATPAMHVIGTGR